MISSPRKLLVLASGLIIAAGAAAYAGYFVPDTKAQVVQGSVSTEALQAKKALVVYFTYSENIGDTSNMDVDAVTSASLHGSTENKEGNMQVMAHEIQQRTGADVYSIVVQDPYDSFFDNMTNRAKQEIEQAKAVALRRPLPDFTKYDVIYFGTPIWWYTLPAPVSSFLKQVDMSGKTIVPFGIHRGSGFNKNLETIQELQPKTKLTDGFTVDARIGNQNVKQQFDAFLDKLLK